MNAAQLEKICLSLRGTTTDVKWGHDLCYLVGKKMYCVTGLDGPFTVSFKATPEEFAALIERNGIIPAPYVAKHHWVFVENPGTLRPTEWRWLIEKSYQLVVEKLPKKIQASL